MACCYFSYGRVRNPQYVIQLRRVVMTSVSASHNPVSEVKRVVGYARVSTEEQKLGLQLDALQRHGCVHVYEDLGASGSLRVRPGLDQCLSELCCGDVLVVWRLD